MAVLQLPAGVPQPTGFQLLFLHIVGNDVPKAALFGFISFSNPNLKVASDFCLKEQNVFTLSIKSQNRIEFSEK